MKGILVAMMVMNCTFESGGRLAMNSTARPTSATSIRGSGASSPLACGTPRAMRAVISVAYTSTKHAITGLTKSTSLDGRAYDIACGQIDIGNAITPMTERMTKGVLQPDGSTRVEPRMDVEAVANAIVYMDSLPLDANVQFMTVMATKMPFVGRG